MMKKKRGLKTQPSVRIQRKMILQYAAAGVALIIITSVGLFFYFNLGTSTDSEASTADFYSVTDGFWSDGPTWAGGVAPATNAISSDIEVFEFVTRSGDLTYASGSNKTLFVTDTLFIYGNLDMGNKSNLTVNDGGVLIITGNFSADNKITVGNGGVIVVGGDMNFPSNRQDTYTESGSGSGLYVGGNVSGNGDAASAEKEISALENEFPEIYELYSGSSGALPVTLVYFKAKSLDDKVELLWETAEEVNNDYFTVERSEDGRTFETITTVPGAGDSYQPIQYSYRDTKPLPGVSYYRLRQTDFDGRFEQFDAIAVSHTSKEVDSPSLIVKSVAPNPFDVSFTVSYELQTTGSVLLQLMNFNGAVVASETVDAAAGYNQHLFEPEDQLESGMYLLKLYAGQHSSKAIRVIKR